MTTPYGPLKGDTSYGIQQMNEWKDIIKLNEWKDHQHE